jgi:hypothetical protein
MHDLSRAFTRNTLARPAAVPASAADLPAHNTSLGKTAALAGVLPSLPNSDGLPVVSRMTSSLPRESLPRIMNPAGVPLTDAARFSSPL